MTAELDTVARLAREAGRILMTIYATEFDVAFKGKSDPVTEADVRANQHIVRGLREAFPDDAIVAEEGSDHGDATRGGRVWFVDPLDGTKEFVSRNGEFAVMIGLAIDGEARLGVVYQPTEDRLLLGRIGHGAQLVHGDTTRELHVSEEPEPSRLALVVSRSHRSSKTDRLVQALGITSERASGSVGLKIGLLATREADLYVHVSDKSSAWDACGPEAILRAAGGRFTDLDGDAFVYGRAVKNSRGILACNAAAFDAVLPAVRAVGREAGLIPAT